MANAFKYYIPGAKYWPGIFRIKTSRKELFLTFDDGPTPHITEWILDTLAAYDARATFFMIGKNAERYPYLYREICLQGQAVGHHTYSHLNGLKSFNARYFSDVEAAAGIIDSRLFRPPYGKMRPSQILKLRKSYAIVFWDVITRDFDVSLDTKTAFEIIKNKTKNGSIIVFHDSKKAENNMKILLPQVLDYFSKQGYVFSKIDASAIQSKMSGSPR